MTHKIVLPNKSFAAFDALMIFAIIPMVCQAYTHTNMHWILEENCGIPHHRRYLNLRCSVLLSVFL